MDPSPIVQQLLLVSGELHYLGLVLKVEEFHQDRSWSGSGVFSKKGGNAVTILNKWWNWKVLYAKQLRDQSVHEPTDILALDLLGNGDESQVVGPVPVLGVLCSFLQVSLILLQLSDESEQ